MQIILCFFRFSYKKSATEVTLRAGCISKRKPTLMPTIFAHFNVNKQISDTFLQKYLHKCKKSSNFAAKNKLGVL